MSTKFVIIDKKFLVAGYSEKNPYQVHHWQLWPDRAANAVYAQATERVQGFGKNLYRFPVEDGVIGLCNRAGQKYAYFRAKAFHSFLRRYGITAVDKKNPNQVWKVCTHKSLKGTMSWKLWTDGQATTVRTGGRFDGKDNIHQFQESDYDITITGATWVVLYKKDYKAGNQSTATILYSLVENVATLDLSPVFSAPKAK